MGEIALKGADITICTDDDPSTENRLQILNDLTAPVQEKFLAAGKSSYIIPERKYAFQLALDLANPGDIILFAGKGHEQVQLTNFGKKARNDYEMLLQL